MVGMGVGLILFGAAVPAVAEKPAGEWDLSAEVGLEARVFANKPDHPGQSGNTFSPSLFIAPEIIYEWNGGDDRATLKPFLRLDRDDDNRSHFDIREANWLHLGDGHDLVVGIDKVFWGVAESRHLVDVINQDDRVEDLDGEDKLGQPMIQMAVSRDWGTLTGFVLPGFRERSFPSDDARLRGALPIAGDDATYDAGREDRAIDIAVRYTQVFGDVDFGISHFHGTSREPRLSVVAGATGPELRPHYDRIDQTGVDVQYTADAWLWKLEAIGRGGHGSYFGAAVAGVEYTLYQIRESDADLGLLAEYLYDGRDENGDAPLTAFENDVFFGARLTLNDPEDTTLLAGAIIDVGDRSTLATLEASRRIGADWKVEIEARALIDIAPSDVLSGVRKDDFVTFRLTRFFECSRGTSSDPPEARNPRVDACRDSHRRPSSSGRYVR